MKRLFISSLLLLGSAMLSQGQAAPQIDTRGLVVNPVVNDLQVNLFSDRDTSGEAVPNYTEGDRMTLSVGVNRDAYVYLFSVDSVGRIDLLLPNRYSGGDNLVRGGSIKQFPQQGAGFEFTVTPPYGINKVFAIASTQQLNLDSIYTFANDKFAQVLVNGSDSVNRFTRGLQVTLNTVSEQSWVSDVISYNTVPKGNQYAQGMLNISSNPANAAVYIGNKLVGYTPLSAKLNAGRYDLKLMLDGYVTFSSNINVSGNQTTTVNAPLALNQAQLAISANTDARIYINGYDKGALQRGRINLTLKPGTYEITLMQANYHTLVQTVTIGSGSNNITLNLNKL